MYQTSGVEHVSLRATMGIRAHPGLISGKTSSSQSGRKPQKVRRADRSSISVFHPADLGGKLLNLIANRIPEPLFSLVIYVNPSPRSRLRSLNRTGE